MTNGASLGYNVRWMRAEAMAPSSPNPIAAARRLSPRIRELAAATESGRRLPAELVDDFRAAGLFRMGIPSSVGGDEVPVETLLRAIEEVSHADGSAGWCVMIAATSGVVAAYLDPDEARTIFSSSTVAGGAFAPSGTAEPLDGAFRVSGRWRFVSGCEHSDWLLNGCVIDGVVAGVVLPRADVEILDTWDVSGLRGTGSHDVTVSDALVPASRTFSFVRGRVTESGPLYRFPIFGLLALGVAGVALGIARRAIDELVDLAAGKVPTLGQRRLADRGTVQADVARAEALYDSARSLLYSSVDEAWDADDLTVAHRARLRLAATNAARSCADAVDLCYDAGGGTSIYTSSPLQRCFRDAHAVTQHMIVAPATYELLGRLRLGVESDTAML